MSGFDIKSPLEYLYLYVTLLWYKFLTLYIMVKHPDWALKYKEKMPSYCFVHELGDPKILTLNINNLRNNILKFG
jgi:hypothetical protein